MVENQNPSSITVAITGATGLVGGHAAAYLAKQGYRVIAIGRSAGKLENTALIEKLEKRVADVEDKEAIAKAISEADVVVHAAAQVDPYGSRQLIFDTNVGGTRNVLSASKNQGVKQIIYISSLSVITGQGDQYDVDETEPLKPCGEAYADSKVEAERLIMAENARAEAQTADEANAPPLAAIRIRVTALRPGFIYGPGERAWMPRLIESIASGKAMLIDGGAKETNVIYVENLSRAIASAVLNERAYGQVYNLTDGEKVTKKRLFDAIADGLSLPRVNKVIPSFVARTVCDIVSSVAPLMPSGMQRKFSRFSRAAFRLAGVNQGFNISKAERDLNYVDRVSFDEGMKETLATFKSKPNAVSVKGGLEKEPGADLIEGSSTGLLMVCPEERLSSLDGDQPFV